MRSRLLSAFAAVCLSLAFLSGLILAVGTSQPLMCSWMRELAPPEVSWFPAQEYDGMTRMLTAYLAGNEDTFSYVFPGEGGTLYEAFNSKEQAHMADCRALFLLCRQINLICSAAGLLTAGLLLLRRRLDDRSLCRGFLLSIAPLVLLALWALIDFNSLFILFHRIAFTNDLWLLDPATDLLIRLMPVTLFTRYAALIGGGWAILCFGAAGLTHLRSIRKQRQ